MGTTPMIVAKNTFEMWKALNDFLIYEDDEPVGLENIEGPWCLNRDFGLSRFNVTLRAENGFGGGMPRPNLPFFDYEKRLKTLELRYIDPPLWQEGVDRIKAKAGKLASPMSFGVQFHRRPTSEMKVPTGGGCLQTLNLIQFKKTYRLHFTMRASEVTCRLLSDLYFFEMLCKRIQDEVNIKGLDMLNVPVDITIMVASQVKHYIGNYILLTKGLPGIEDFFVNTPPRTEWQKKVVHHFWEDYIFPENINWSQRQAWSFDFYDLCERLNKGKYIDWRARYHERSDKDTCPPPKVHRGAYKTKRAKAWIEQDPDLRAQDEEEGHTQTPSKSLDEAREAQAKEDETPGPSVAEATPPAPSPHQNVKPKNKGGRPKGSKTKKKEVPVSITDYGHPQPQVHSYGPFKFTF